MMDNNWYNNLPNEWKEFFHQYVHNYGCEELYKNLLTLRSCTLDYSNSKAVTDLKGLKYCTELRQITINNKNIKSLQGIEFCFKLNRLSLLSDSFFLTNRDVALLKNCYNLYYIDVCYIHYNIFHKLKNLLPYLTIFCIDII